MFESIKIIIKSISDCYQFILENKPMSIIIGSIFSTIVYFSGPIKTIIYNKLYPDKIELELKYEQNRHCSGCEFPLTIFLIQRSEGNTIKSGVIRIELSDPLSFKNPNQQSASISEFSGTLQAYNEPVDIRIKPNFVGIAHLKINYKNPTVDITKSLPINVTAKDKKDSPRIMPNKNIDLTGTWNINIGADFGEMTIKQDEKSRIDGNYNLHTIDNNTITGIVSGFKDGTAFRVIFYKSGKDDIQKRVEAVFERNSEDEQYIEIKGCSYGIKKDVQIKKNTEGSKITNCIDTKDYFGWRGVTVSEFYASAYLQK